jgi:peptidoglycan hydrolase-like protein with peptidoglycan-binding domain
MSGTTASEQAAGAGTSSRACYGRRVRLRRWVAVVTAVVAVAAVMVVTAAVTGGFGGSGPAAGTAGGGYATSIATITRRSLVSQTQVNATLGFAGSYRVTAKGGGTLTWLPAPGQVLGQGQVLYRVNNGAPVFLLYGRVPAWRALSEGIGGADVAQLNRNLIRLGYTARAALGPRSGWEYFSTETAAAVEDLQAHLGLPVTGTLPLGQVVFLPTALRVTTLNASLGDPAAGTVLSATSTIPVVIINLDAARQSDVQAGDKVTITLPDGSTTPGVVSSVGTVAKGSGNSATVTVLVTLTRPKAAGHLDQAPVTVAITTGSVRDALVAPVTALLAQPAGGYAVEEVTARGQHHLVPVSVGMSDDAAGLVQVTGPGLAAGQHVVVPAP